uniref:Uncharacterized protein n=1 Tax=Leersia perrieri TaxID=77586 RepID=A0A0D9W9Z2_9ORYZ
MGLGGSTRSRALFGCSVAVGSWGRCRRRGGGRCVSAYEGRRPADKKKADVFAALDNRQQRIVPRDNALQAHLGREIEHTGRVGQSETCKNLSGNAIPGMVTK